MVEPYAAVVGILFVEAVEAVEAVDPACVIELVVAAAYADLTVVAAAVAP